MSTVVNGSQYDENGNVLIYTVDDFVTFCSLYNDNKYSSNSNKIFHLMNDIDLSSTAFEMIENFTQIFDGHGYSITLNIGDLDTDNVALFKINRGTIKRLSVSGIVNGRNYVGGIVARNIGGTVKWCTSDCTITTIPLIADSELLTYTGGICGENVNDLPKLGTITECKNNGSISGNIGVGGICGLLTSGTVNNCYSASESLTLCSESQCGGIVGNCLAGGVSKCYNVGSVSYSPGYPGATYLGAIVGKYSGPEGYHEISNCVYLTGTAARGIGNPEISDLGGFIIAKTDVEFKLKVTFTNYNYNYDTIWLNFEDYHLDGSSIANTYPFLKFELSYDNCYDTSWFNTNRPDQYIRTADQFAGISAVMADLNNFDNDINYFIEQKNNISFHDKMFNNQIGKSGAPFNIIYDGKSFELSDLNLRTIRNETSVLTADRMMSVFGYNSGTIQNVKLYFVDSYSEEIGCSTLVEYNRGNILNCEVSNSIINSSKSYMAGMCGINYNTIHNCKCSLLTIDNTSTYTGGMSTVYEDVEFHGCGGMCCLNYGDILNSELLLTSSLNTISDNIGGLCGLNYGRIDSSKVGNTTSPSLTIDGNLNVGGICGSNYNLIINCSSGGDLATNSTIDIDGNSNVGGICGLNSVEIKNNIICNNGKIRICYNNAAIVNSETENCGGLVGYNNKSEISNSFTTPIVVLSMGGTGSKIGGIAGSFSGELINCYSLSQFEDPLTASYAGGLIGYLIYTDENSDTISSKFTSSYNQNRGILSIGGNEITSTPYDIPSDMVTKTESELKLLSTFSGWDILENSEKDGYDTNIWVITSESTFPVFNYYFRDTKNIIPKTSNYQSLGLENKKFDKMFADEFNGYLKGVSEETTKLHTARNINITGKAISDAVPFNGENNISLNVSTIYTSSLSIDEGDTLILNGGDSSLV